MSDEKVKLTWDMVDGIPTAWTPHGVMRVGRDGSWVTYEFSWRGGEYSRFGFATVEDATSAAERWLAFKYGAVE